MRINAGSGQRPFGLPRPEVPDDHACEFCREGKTAHDNPKILSPYQHPRSTEFDIPHRYVPSGPDAWINIDINSRWNPDIVADCASMPMFADGSAEIIVLHHVLEHAGLGECNGVIRDCHRILMPGGSLIVTVPDLDALARAWIAGRISDYIYCVQVYGAYMDNEADRHKFGYTPKTLRNTLREIGGWSFVKPFDWRIIPGTSIARDWYIIGIEAFK